MIDYTDMDTRELRYTRRLCRSGITDHTLDLAGHLALAALGGLLVGPTPPLPLWLGAVCIGGYGVYRALHHADRLYLHVEAYRRIGRELERREGEQ